MIARPGRRQAGQARAGRQDLGAGFGGQLAGNEWSLDEWREEWSLDIGDFCRGADAT